MSKAAYKLYSRFGIVLILISIYALVDTAVFFSKSKEGVGVVTDYKVGGGGVHSSNVYYPIIRFKCCNDIDIEFVGKPGTNPPDYAIGEDVSLLFNPAKPEDAKIYSFSSMLLLPLFGLGFGFVLWFFHRE